MKISISYPPLENEKGTPLLSQNRQFQWFQDPTYIYPMVPAYAATMLKNEGFDVIWDDGIASAITYEQWRSQLVKESPGIVVIESKTPVIKRHWRIIDALKESMEHVKIVLAGDHVTALPEESMRNSKVDFILTGGDYDFLLVSLCKALAEGNEGKVSSKATKNLEPGIWFRENGHVKNTGPFVLAHDLSRLPYIDRSLTQWRKYAYENGNFKQRPGTYVMAGRDCWWGQCTFCSWTTLYPGKSFRAVPPVRHLEEVGRLTSDLGVKEIFDDSGCFPKGKWLETFCRGMIDRGYHKKVALGCNTRVGAQTAAQFRLMKKANFRFLLIGLESINQATLNKLRKGIRVEEIERTCRLAKNAGLEPHITTMVGYPWETEKDARSTIDFAASLLRKGAIDSLQATIVVPYPGTPIFNEAKKNGWLTTENWSDFDMTQLVWNSGLTNESALQLTRAFYKTALDPRFILRKILSVRNVNDLEFLLRAGKKVIHHILDFKDRKRFQASN